MDRAYSLTVGKEYHAEELSGLGNAEEHEWRCHYCLVKEMEPKAWDAERRMKKEGKPFKKRPYFAVKHGGGSHSCDALVNQQSIAGKEKAIRRESNGPAPIYNALRLRTKRPFVGVLENTDGSSSEIISRTRYRGKAARQAPDGSHKKSAGTIAPLCREYESSKYTIDNRYLDVGNHADGHTYGTVFAKLKDSPLNSRIEGTRIFVARILYSDGATIEINDNSISIPIYDGVRREYSVDAHGVRIKTVTHRRLIIDTSTWSKRNKTSVAKQISRTVTESMSSRTSSPLIFFLGGQVSDDAMTFTCNRKEFVCAFPGEL